ncbi:MAG: carbohydrate kinase family protein [Thermoleophilaceae bacterium]
MADLDLLVLGDLNPDLVLGGDGVEPAFGQVERLVDTADLVIGGSGAIVACGAARLGLRTAIAGVVGDDLFGRFMLDALSAHRVDTGGVVVDPGLQTGLTVVLAREGDRAMLTFPGAIPALRADAVDPDLVRSARHVHVSSYFLQTSLAPGLAELFRMAEGTTSIDPNWDPAEDWDAGLRELLPLTDVFLPNAEEAVRIAGRADPEEAALALSGEGPLVVVKLGAEGALAVRGEELVRVAAPAGVEPVDTTGAGDSFDAGVLAGLLGGWPLERALALGCACGALSTRAAGGTASQPTLEEAAAA